MLWHRCGRVRAQRVLDMMRAISAALNADPDAIFNILCEAGVDRDAAARQCMKMKIEQASAEAAQKMERMI